MNTHKKQIQTPQKKSRTGSHTTHLQSRNSASKYSGIDQEKCCQTSFSLSDIRIQHLTTSDVCYHKIQMEILDQIESTDKKLTEEIKASQIEMKLLLQQLMDSDTIRAGEGYQNLKVKNNININMVANSNRSGSSIASNSINQLNSQKEETKQQILDKVSKKFAPNFIEEDQILPATYSIFQPQDQDKIIKAHLMSDETNQTLDNSYMSRISIDPTTLSNATKVLKRVDSDFEFCVYDFQPANPNFLLLQRLDYMTKQQKIKNYLRNQFRERIDMIKFENNRYHNTQQQWLTNVEIQKRPTDKQLKMKYPQIFEEFRLEQKHLTGIFNQYAGLHPQLLGSGQKNQNNQDYDDWDDIQRYRDNKADISMSRFRFYQHEVKHEPYQQIIKNPLEYELEYKKRMIWSLKDIETFLTATLENPKNFWAIGKYLPHKSSKELVFFFQAFKKLFNLKKHFNTCQVMIGLPSQAGKKQAIQDIINEVMRPIQKYQQEKRNPTNIFDINQGVAACFYGQNQIYFTVQELLQIYSGISEVRRKCKETDKDRIVDQKLSHYYFNTFSPPSYNQEEKKNLESIDYFDKVELIGQKLLDHYQSQLSSNIIKEGQGQGQGLSNLARKIAMYINLMQSQKQLMPQKLIKESLKSTNQKDLLLRKRNFNEFYYQTSGRDISKWVLQKQIIVEDNNHYAKRQRLSSSNFEITNSIGATSNSVNHSSQTKFQYEMRTYNYSASGVFPQFVTVKQQSFTEKFIEELNKEKLTKIEQTKKIEEDSKKQQQILQQVPENISKVNPPNMKGKIQVDIQKEFNNDKEFKNYMDKRFNSIFVENSSSEDSNDVDDSSNNRQRKGLLQWQDDEKEKFIMLLKKHGRDWCAIADELPRKTDKQCRNYFQNYKHKLNLQQYLPDKK